MIYPIEIAGSEASKQNFLIQFSGDECCSFPNNEAFQIEGFKDYFIKYDTPLKDRKPKHILVPIFSDDLKDAASEKKLIATVNNLIMKNSLTDISLFGFNLAKEKEEELTKKFADQKQVAFFNSKSEPAIKDIKLALINTKVISVGEIQESKTVSPGIPIAMESRARILPIGSPLTDPTVPPISKAPTVTTPPSETTSVLTTAFRNIGIILARTFIPEKEPAPKPGRGSIQ